MRKKCKNAEDAEYLLSYCALSSSFVFALLDEIAAFRRRETLLIRNERETEELRESLRDLLTVVAKKDEELRKAKVDILLMQKEFDDVLASPIALSSFKATVAIAPEDRVLNYNTIDSLHGTSNLKICTPVDENSVVGGEMKAVSFDQSSSKNLGISGISSAHNMELSFTNFVQKDETLGVARRKMLSFEMSEVPKCEDAYRVMRCIIPLDVFRLSVSTMTEKYALPPSIACRLWEKKTLWLIVMHKDDISKIHIADLRGKFQYDNSYDIVEMRAIWKCLPEWGSGDKKAEWRDDFKRRLNTLAHLENTGSLSGDCQRNRAYRGYEPFEIFNPNAEIKERYNVAFQEQSPDKIFESTDVGSFAIKRSSHNDLNGTDFDFHDVMLTVSVDNDRESASVSTNHDIQAEFLLPVENNEIESQDYCSSYTDMKSKSCSNVISNKFGRSMIPLHEQRLDATSPDIFIGNIIDEHRFGNMKDSGVEQCSKNVQQHCGTFDFTGTSRADCAILTRAEDENTDCLVNEEFSNMELHSMMDKAQTCETHALNIINHDKQMKLFARGSPICVNSECNVDSCDIGDSCEATMKIILSDDLPNVPVDTRVYEGGNSEVLFNETYFHDSLQQRDDVVLEDLDNWNEYCEENFVLSADSWISNVDKLKEVEDRNNLVVHQSTQGNINFDNVHSDGIINDVVFTENDLTSNKLYGYAVQMDDDSSSRSQPVDPPDFEDYITAFRPLPDERVTLKLLRENLEALIPFFVNKHHYVGEDFDFSLGKQKANEFLLKCADDPEKLQDGLNTFKFLVEIMHADVNAINDHDGRSALSTLFNVKDIGTYLIQKGADIFMKDNSGTSVLDLCVEYNEVWILEAFEATLDEKTCVLNDQCNLTEYVVALIKCGYASRAVSFMNINGENQSSVHIGKEKASQIMRNLDGKSLAEPVETFELLIRCGAYI